MYKIKFTDAEGGWFKGHIGINEYIYGRTDSKKKALKLDKAEALYICQDANNYGYSCKIKPKITVTY
jgi:hypothetical protein